MGLEVLTAATAQLASLARQAGRRTRTPETVIRGVAQALAGDMGSSDYLDGCAKPSALEQAGEALALPPAALQRG